MSGLPLSYYLEHVPGVSEWLRELDESGYMLGSELAEGRYLGSDADGAATADKILLLLEADGAIRRGELRPSHSQMAFGSWQMGGMGTKRQEQSRSKPATWYAWHPAATWRHPAFRGEQTPRVERCDFCSTGACFTHKKAVAR